MTDVENLPPLPLPKGISSAYIDCTKTCGLKFHILEAGREAGNSRPMLLLCHGYPELAYTWRDIMPALAAAGYYVVAPDQRGYGRTTGYDSRSYDQVDLSTYRLTQQVRDYVALVNALGYADVHSIIGHDFGAVTASTCALVRPDFFKSVVMMSHPFKGSPTVPFNTGRTTDGPSPASSVANKDTDIETSLANLTPPRKHYKWYNSTPGAAHDWDNPEQGMMDFMRGYVHLKSALYPPNKPYPLGGWVASELAKMPNYYIMPLEMSMPQTVAHDMKDQDFSASKSFISDEELAVYAQEFSRTGFQPALNWYRSVTANNNPDMIMFAGKKIECPSVFISGSADWGNCQEPGALEGFDKTCSDFRGVKFIDNAGHWPQAEQPKQVTTEVLTFLKAL